MKIKTCENVSTACIRAAYQNLAIALINQSLESLASVYIWREKKICAGTNGKQIIIEEGWYEREKIHGNTPAHIERNSAKRFFDRYNDWKFWSTIAGYTDDDIRILVNEYLNTKIFYVKNIESYRIVCGKKMPPKKEQPKKKRRKWSSKYSIY